MLAYCLGELCGCVLRQLLLPPQLDVCGAHSTCRVLLPMPAAHRLTLLQSLALPPHLPAASWHHAAFHTVTAVVGAGVLVRWRLAWQLCPALQEEAPRCRGTHPHTLSACNSSLLCHCLCLNSRCHCLLTVQGLPHAFSFLGWCAGGHAWQDVWSGRALLLGQERPACRCCCLIQDLHQVV